MAKLLVKQNATSRLATVFIQDNSKTTGAGLGSLVYNTSGLTAYYFREGDASSTAISLATMTLGTWATGGFIVADGTNMLGTYQLGLPNACFTALGSVVVYLQGAANMAPIVLEFQVVAFDPTDAVHLGLSALPNTACTTNASLLTSGTGTDQLSVTSGIAQANVEQWDSVAIAEPSTDGIPDVNVLNWRNQAVPATNVSGVPLIDAKYLLGTVFATPATAGIMDVNAKNINNVSTSSVTAINANLGTTQAITFDANNLTKVSVEDWHGTAVAGAISPDVVLIRSGTAQAGGASTITLDAGASATTNLYQNEIIFIRSGTGAGQSAIIASYVGSTKVATIVGTWATNPDSTSVFSILPFGSITATVSGGVNVTQWLGVGVSAATGGIPDVNTKNYNNQTAQTDGNNLPKVDLVDIAGSAVSTSTAQLGVNVVQYNAQTAQTDANNLPKVDVEDIRGTLSAGTAGYIGPDWGHVNAPTTTLGLTGTTIATSQVIATVTNAVTLSAGDSPILQSGTAAGGTATTLTLASAIGTTADPVGCKIKITSGTGAKQERTITAYNNATPAVTVNYAWVTTPDNTSVYTILFDNAPKIDSSLRISEVVLVDTLTTYTGNTPQTGDSFARLGAPAGATIANDIAEIEAETDGIAAIPTSNPSAAAIATAIFQDTTPGDFTVAGSIGKSLFTSGNAPGAAGGLAIVGSSMTVGGYASGQDPAVRKNQALASFAFVMISSTDHVTPKTGLGSGITCQRSLDGGALASCANAAAELSNGIYVINLAAGDLNANVVVLRFSAAGADDADITIVTQP